MRLIDLLVIHCSATPAGLDIGAADLDVMHRARGFHFDPPTPEGLHSIGYHYVIQISGVVETGRPIELVGAHVKGHNANSIGVCLVGGLDAARKPANTYTLAQWRALHELVDQLQAQFPTIRRVVGHRDLSPDKNHDGRITRDEWMKECPCFDVATWYAGRAEHEGIPA